MFDIMNYAEKNHVEIDVRPGTNPVVWEFFIRDRQLDIVQFTQIHSRELDRQSNPDWYIEQRCESMMEAVREELRQAVMTYNDHSGRSAEVSAEIEALRNEE